MPYDCHHLSLGCEDLSTLFFLCGKSHKGYNIEELLACLADSEEGRESHLAALTGADTIVVP